MSKYYLYKTKCNFGLMNEAVIYQLASTKTPRSWYVRIKKTGRGYHQESLETTNKAAAIEKAEKIWFQYRNSEETGIKYGKRRFNDHFLRFIESRTWSESRGIRVKFVFKRYFSDFFSDYSIDQIDHHLWTEYLDWRLNYWQRREDAGQSTAGNAKKKPSINTIRSERQLLLQFLRWLHLYKHIAQVPPISAIYDPSNLKKMNSNRTRGLPMSSTQYASIIRRLRNWSIHKDAEEKNWVHSFARKRLFYFIVISTNCLLRMGTEATGMKWRDLKLVDSTRYPNTKVALWYVRQGKMGGRDKPAVSTYRGLLHILRWRSICAEYGFGKDSDFVFPNWNGEQIPTFYLNKTLQLRLQEWDDDTNHMTLTPSNTKITLYSFRATAISRRITKSKWDIIQVAEAANTSVATISKHYAGDWIEQDPDRYADTSKKEMLYLGISEQAEIEDLLAEFE